MSETPPDEGSGSGKYRTLFELGQGGTANVSLAVARGPEGFRKLFVVKRLRAAYAQDPDFRAMFMTEARLSARLNHPHVVRVYEVLEPEATPTILMEYIEGQTLDAVLDLPERLPLELHLRILADVLSGLHYSHELLDLEHAPLNVVHRDVSPHNVMVSYEGVVKVLDFGIAQLSGTTVETARGVIKGKLRYMPPEQIGGQDVDRRADVFAVGVMLWEALSGSKLWKGLSDARIMKRVLAGDIPPPQDLSGEIPPELAAICVRALAPDREQRFQTALELELALEDYLAQRSHDASARELGRFMVQRFAEVRAGVEQRIENEMGRGESSRPPMGWPVARGFTPTRTGYAASRSSPGEPPRSRLWIGALACVALGVLIILWGLHERPELVSGATSNQLAVGGASRNVGISIEARPANAELSIDGVPVSNPYVVQRSRDASRHRLRISAPGYAPEEAELTFDVDVRVFRALSPLPISAVAVGGAPGSTLKLRPQARATAPVSSSAPVAPTCDPAYFFDARGIKKFKPECI
jgi:eukaryotic-like serine/threonine-protein kinase